MRAIDRRVMLFKVKDLMVTVLPDLDLSDADGSTVGSCTSEHDRNCDLSLEVLELTPYSHIDPPYLAELRLLLEHALARSRVVVPNGLDLAELESRMRPRRVEDIYLLERQLTNALEELRAQRAEIEGFVAQNPGWRESEPNQDKAEG
jgi:hypothetical protein